MDRTTEELTATQEELAQYRCPYCRAELDARVDVDLNERDSDVVESFACGYETLAGMVQRPCPSDPRFPKLEDYDLLFRPVVNDPLWQWQCYAMPKTNMARMVNLGSGLGKTKEEAAERVRDQYRHYSRK